MKHSYYFAGGLGGVLAPFFLSTLARASGSVSLIFGLIVVWGLFAIAGSFLLTAKTAKLEVKAIAVYFLTSTLIGGVLPWIN